MNLCNFPNGEQGVPVSLTTDTIMVKKVKASKSLNKKRGAKKVRKVAQKAIGEWITKPGNRLAEFI
jgi:hypothetical protein